MPGIFVSYRRSDSGGHTGRLTSDLIEGFEPQQLFRDLEAIEAGTDFAQAIDRAVNTCSVMLAMIGPQWLSAATPDGKRRLELDNDFVRLEIAAALARNLRVIPVLVGGATMPAADQLPEPLKPLAGRQAHEISDRRWDYDIGLLFDTLEKIPGVSRRKPKPALQAASGPAPAAAASAPGKRGSSLAVKALAGVGGVVVLLMILGALTGNDAEEPALAPPPAAVADSSPPASSGAPPASTQHAAVAPLAATGRSEAPPSAAVDDAAMAPPVATNTAVGAQPAGASVNLTGLWHNDEGDELYLEQNGQELAVIAADGSAEHGFMGQGMVRGQRVELTLVHLQSGASVAMQMSVSPDGRRMSGTARENVNGSTHNIAFMRE
jgi:hypothetical protein